MSLHNTVITESDRKRMLLTLYSPLLHNFASSTHVKSPVSFKQLYANRPVCSTHCLVIEHAYSTSLNIRSMACHCAIVD